MESVAAKVKNTTSGSNILKVELELERLTLSQLVEFLQTCREKYRQAQIEPGFIKIIL